MIGENFPYTNFHDMNTDWLIKIAKDFLDQYTHLQETITNGLQDLDDKTAAGLAGLQEKYEALDALLQAWYNEHSEDIANELASALADISTALDTALTNFSNEAAARAAEAIATVPGDYTDLTNKVNQLKNKLIEITQGTSNLLDVNGITIGINGSGNTGYSKRALSNIMHVGTYAKVKAINLPANLKYDIERYTTSDPATRVGSGSWVTNTNVQTYHADQEYIAILFGSVDNADLTPADFVGLKMQVNAGSITKYYEPFQYAVDDTVRCILTPMLTIDNPAGLFPVSKHEWEQGNINGSGEEIANDQRIRTKNYIEINNPISLKMINYNNDGFSIAFAEYDSEYTYIRTSTYNTDNPFEYSIAPNCKYIRILMMKQESGSNVEIYPEMLSDVAIKVFYPGESSMPANIKLMNYNIGRYSYGTSPYGLNDDNYDEKLLNYRRFFGLQDCDIVCLTEFDRILKDGTDIDANDEIFSHWYNYRADTGNWEAIKSKYRIQNDYTGQLVTSDRYYESCVVTI